MHLSRLWTDTPVFSKVKIDTRSRKDPAKEFSRETNRKKEERESTSAPVTSVDRHTGTETLKEKGHRQKRREERRETKGGTSAPVTFVDRHTSTKEKQEEAVQKGEKRGGAWERWGNKLKGGEYECTCHVCGQTHKYTEWQWAVGFVWTSVNSDKETAEP